MEGNSTESALLYFLSKVADMFNKGNFLCVIFIDYSKAFDSVHHGLLIKKLEYQFGISAEALKWIASFLYNRFQYTYIDDYKSASQKVKYGVPQGSILGPLLFLCYINDITSCINHSDTHIIQYADDTAVLIGSDSLNDLKVKAGQIISSIYNYCSMNHVFINLTKTKLMYLKKNLNDTNNLSIACKDDCIESVGNYCYLGYNVDDDLSFKLHIETLSKKLSTCNFFLARCYSIIPGKALKDLF